MASTEPEHEHREEEEAQAGDDEDTGAQVAPIVKLEEVAVTTGEEDEEAILDLYDLHFCLSIPHGPLVSRFSFLVWISES